MSTQEQKRGSLIECPVEIGGSYWIAAPTGERVAVPCPVCAGNKTVDLILGSGERVTIECEGCGKGYDGPRGYVHEYRQTPAIKRVIVDRVSSMPSSTRDWWTFYLLPDGYCDERELFNTEAEAMAAAVAKKVNEDEANMRSHQSKKANATNGGWTVRYHRDQIKKLQRQLEWHQSKVTTREAS